jgi:hypothetical protein
MMKGNKKRNKKRYQLSLREVVLILLRIEEQKIEDYYIHQYE